MAGKLEPPHACPDMHTDNTVSTNESGNTEETAGAEPDLLSIMWKTAQKDR